MCTYIKMKILFEICMTPFNNKVTCEELGGCMCYLPVALRPNVHTDELVHWFSFHLIYLFYVLT